MGDTHRGPAASLRAILIALLACTAAVPAAGVTSYAGSPLASALGDLQARGLRLVFTDQLVPASLLVTAEPSSADSRRALDELLAPHGLAVREGPNGTLVVVRAARRRPPEADRPAAEVPVPAAVFAEEVQVTPSQVSMLRETPLAPLSLQREDILALPHLADDLFRALTLLPGATGNDVSAQFHVRGARRDETQILLDGQELYDAYHLRDYDAAASAISSSALAAADLTTGGFAARYGDRMAGVLDMTTLEPAGAARHWLGLSALAVQLGSAGSFLDGRGAWLAAARRGSTDLVGKLLANEDPRYWDLYGKVQTRLGQRVTLRASALFADDRLTFDEEVDGETKRFDTAYANQHVWLTLDTLVGSSLLVETSGALARVERDRRGDESEEDVRFGIRDRRDLDVGELRQHWTWAAPRDHLLEWGLQLRHFSSDYDYRGVHDFDHPLARIRHDFGRDETRFQGEFREDHEALYATDRIRLLPSLAVELGLRHDRYTESGQSSTSPRLNLAWAVGGRSVVRLAWGRFDQSQRLYELQVEDGETAFAPVERSQHRVLGFETLLPGGAGRPLLAARLEVYQREVENPRPRYENLFEPINPFPEVEPDRVRIAPSRSRAEGAELFLRGALGERWRWWLSYSYASTEDRIASDWTPRSFDERQALKLDLDYRAGERWRVNLAWRYHTGWPTTALSAAPLPQEPDEPDDPEEPDEPDEPAHGASTALRFGPVLGPLNGSRLPSYHRLDLRASRSWRTRWGRLDAFVDVQNLYDRRNVAGFDYQLDEDTGEVERSIETWAGILPSIGITLEF